MRLKLVTLIIGTAAFAAVAIPALAAPQDATLSAKLKGKEEVPGPGDPDGTGTAQLEVKFAKLKICYLIEYELPSGTATAAHVHKGKKGVAGKIVVALFEGKQDSKQESPVEDCVEVKKRKAKKIVETPADYYVNVHNAQFPDGAIRGQLKLVGTGPQ